MTEEIYEKTGVPPEKQHIHTTKRGLVLLWAINDQIDTKMDEDTKTDEREAEIAKMTDIFERYISDDTCEFEITLKKEHIKDITKNVLQN